MKPGNHAYIVPLPSIDSGFGIHTSLGPVDLTDPQMPALMVALSYLGVTEGPLWKAARGSGLAYGVSVSRHYESGHVQLTVYRSPDAYKAFAAVKDVIASYANGKTPLEGPALEGAVSHIVVQFSDNEPNMSGAGTMGFVHQVVHGVNKEYNSELLRKVKQVTPEAIKVALKDIVMPLFYPETSNVVVTSSPVKAEVCSIPSICWG
jgi:Zn-dependent M16 (insulinase) family peptidase